MPRSAFYGLVIVWLLLLGWGYAHLPPSPDQFELTYIGHRMNQGDRPYVDVVDMNWPGGFWLHQVAAAVQPERWYPWRVIDWLIMCLGIGFAADLLRRNVRPLAGDLLWIIYPVLYAGMGWIWFPGQRDAVIGHLLLIAAWCWLRAWRTAPVPWHAAMGIMIGLATLLKPTIAIAGPILVILGCFSHPQQRQAALGYGVVAASSAIATIMLGLVFAIHQGASHSAIKACAWTYNLTTQTAENAGVSGLIDQAAYVHADSWAWILLVAGWAAYHLVTARRSLPADARWLFPTLWLIGWLNYIVQYKGFAYHMGVVFVVMGVLVPVAAERLYRLSRFKSLERWRYAAIAGLVIIGGGTLLKLTNVVPSWRYAAGMTERSAYLDQFLADGDTLTLAEVDRIVAVIEGNTDPEDTALVLSGASIINLQSGRDQPTRFYYYPVLVNAREPFPDADEWQKQFEQDLRENPPAICIIGDRARLALHEAGVPASGVVENLLAYYRPLGRIGTTLIYLRPDREPVDPLPTADDTRPGFVAPKLPDVPIPDGESEATID